MLIHCTLILPSDQKYGSLPGKELPRTLSMVNHLTGSGLVCIVIYSGSSLIPNISCKTIHFRQICIYMFILKADCIVHLCIYININCICNNNIQNQQLLALTMRL